MSTVTYRANLSSAIFPMTLADAGRTVINPQADQNFDRRVDPAGEQKDAGIPQAIYMENVIPTVNGFQSVGYIAGTSLPGSSSISSMKAFYFGGAVIVSRKNLVTGSGSVIANNINCDGAWTTATGTIPTPVLTASIASARGTNYWFDGSKFFTFIINPVSKQISFVDETFTFSGVTPADVKYICSSYNYLILLMKDGSIRWSSTTDPKNFVPSLVTGAGSIVPQDSSGSEFLVPNSEGFIIYGTTGAVFAQYTGNARYPFKFITVTDAGGYSYDSQVAGSSQSNAHYGISNSNKVQLITNAVATVVAPEISTYLEREQYKDVFNYTTNKFSKESYFRPFITKIYYLLDRYIVISMITTNVPVAKPFQFCFFYDKLLQRYGVLKIDHQDIFADETTVCFVPNRGTEIPYKLSLDVYSTTADIKGVLLLGKFQYIRDRFLQLESVEVESVKDISTGGSQNFSLVLFSSLDGKNFIDPITLATKAAGNLITANTHKTAKNHSLMFKGAFDVNTLQLEFRVAGGR